MLRHFMRVAVTAAALAVSACQTSTPYQPASSPTSDGYRDLRIEDNRFRVTYRAANAEEAHDLALLRAADVTLTNGYEWFRVISAHSDTEQNYGGGRSVSIGGSTGSSGSGVGIGIGLGLGGSQGDTTRVLEFVAGKGPRPSGGDVYDAEEVSASIRSITTN